jgi:D-arabinose 1-dehydrogenase-like Zn-dependent alcohol dehydrogenase
MTVDKMDMDIVADQDYLREADLKQHLTHVTAHESSRPSHVLRYYLPAETRQRLREAKPEDLEENEKEDEFLTRLSAQLLASAQRPGRRDLLRDADSVLKTVSEQEASLVAAELKKLGGAVVVLATAASSAAMGDTVGGLAPQGELVTVGVTPEPLPVSPLDLITPGLSVTGHPSGTSRDVEETLHFAELSGVRAVVQEVPLAEAAEAFDAMITGKAHYRMVLTV